MIEYATIISRSAVGLLEDKLYALTHWLGGVPAYWIVGGVVLFFVFLHLFVKKI